MNELAKRMSVGKFFQNVPKLEQIVPKDLQNVLGKFLDYLMFFFMLS